MDKKTSIKVLMLISTLMSYIEPNEATRKTNKLRKHIRQNLNKLFKKDHQLYDECSKDANEAWEIAKEELSDRNYTIDISSSCRALYVLLSNHLYRNIWFTEKTFEDAMQSIYEAGVKIDAFEYEKNSNILIDIFAKSLNIKRDNRLSIFKKTIEYNLILEGK